MNFFGSINKCLLLSLIGYGEMNYESNQHTWIFTINAHNGYYNTSSENDCTESISNDFETWDHNMNDNVLWRIRSFWPCWR